MSDNKQRTTRVVAIGNQKGGVGKTATAIHLAAALGELGRKTLIWDLDSNTGLTNAFQIPGVYQGSFEVLLGIKDEGEEFCDPTNYIVDEDEEGIALPKGVHVLPASRELDNLDLAWLQSARKFEDVKDALKEPLARLDGLYDYIFLDTGPNVSTCTVASYKAAEWFMLVSEPEPLSVKALEAALSDIAMVRNRGNPGLRLLGIALTCVTKRRSLDQKMATWLKENYAQAGEYGVFKQTISRTTLLPRAQEKGKSLFQTNPDHDVCEQFRAMAREVEARLKIADDEKAAQGASRPSQQIEVIDEKGAAIG